MTITIDDEHLTIEDVVRVARNHEKVKLSEKAKKKVEASRRIVEKKIEKKERIYGHTTGVGGFRDVFLKPELLELFQTNLITSHSSGVGDPFPEDIVRATTSIRINQLARGYSGVSIDVINKYGEMLNNRIYPYVPSQGSLASSGDLCQLAPIAAVAIGLGRAFYKGKVVSGKVAMEKAGVEIYKLKPGEALHLINGASATCAMGALLVYDIERALKLDQIATAMSLEALAANPSPFKKGLHEARPHEGQLKSSKNIRKLIRGSEIIYRKRNKGEEEVQDPYSVRTYPQIISGPLENIKRARNFIEKEMNSTSDNPVVLPDGSIISGGNFQGQQLGGILDSLKHDIAVLSGEAERRINILNTFWMSNKFEGKRLPPYLTKDEGLSSGFMMPAYTAAGLAAENMFLANPASTLSIPVSEGREDYNAMASISGLYARKMLENLRYINAIELVCAAQGIHFRLEKNNPKLGKGTSTAYHTFIKYTPYVHSDKSLRESNYEIETMPQIGVNLSVKPYDMSILLEVSRYASDHVLDAVERVVKLEI